MPGFGDVVSLDGVLTAPSVGEAPLHVPKDWETWDSLFQEVRDGINIIAGAADRIPGVDLPRLPEGSLARLVVSPLTGNWDVIRSRGEACRTVGSGLDAMARNLGAVPLDLAPHWSGLTFVSFLGHHAAYAVALEAASRVVAQGTVVFEAMALVSQQLGEAAVRLLTRLGRLLVRVVRKLARRLAPWLGWVSTAKDLLTDGLGPILDIVEDIIELVDLVNGLLDLVATARAWVEDQVARLRVLLEVRHVTDLLPTIGQAVLGREVLPGGGW